MAYGVWRMAYGSNTATQSGWASVEGVVRNMYIGLHLIRSSGVVASASTQDVWWLKEVLQACRSHNAVFGGSIVQANASCGHQTKRETKYRKMNHDLYYGA